MDSSADNLPIPSLETDVQASRADKNRISFEIASKAGNEGLRVSVAIPCRGKGTNICLMKDAADKVAFRCEPDGKIPGVIKKRENDTVLWENDRPFALKPGEKVTLEITGFEAPDVGEARIDFNIRTSSQAKVFTSYPVPVKESPDGVGISYFAVRPTWVVGGKQVSISCLTSGAKTIVLYSNDKEIGRSPEPDAKKPANWTDTPNRAQTVYVLDAWQDDVEGRDEATRVAAAKAGRLATATASVSVEQGQNWYARDLLDGYYPTLLLSGQDLSGKTPSLRLYGTFVRDGTNSATLWSSSSGFDDWRYEGDVPDGMGESPGVICNNKLLLIGGCSADPTGPRSNRLWWYYKNSNNEMVWEEWDENGGERLAATAAGTLFTPRMGHACAVFQDQVWVLGGLSEQQEALNDVWTCTVPKEGSFTPVWKPLHTTSPIWSGRCMSAVVAAPDQPQLWIYGGAPHPYSLNDGIDELWCTSDGQEWAKYPLPDGTRYPPLGATLLYASDGKRPRLRLLGSFRKPLGRFSSNHTLTDTGTITWQDEKQPFLEWAFPQVDLFLLRSICFNGRWIFWPVYQYIDQIPNVPPIPRIYTP
jgi:hypothetical protein